MDRTPPLLLLLLLLHTIHTTHANAPPSLYRPILVDPTRPPSKIVLAFPSTFMSGGPSHMHSIVAALNHAGFHGAMYRVNERYARDYADGFCCDATGKPFDTITSTPLFRNLTALEPGDLTSRDLLILPPLLHQQSQDTEWNQALELAIRESGVRTIVIVTGISPPELPTALSHFDLTEGSKIPLAHSHFTHMFYKLPWDPETSIMWAPLEPRWLKAHHEFVRKEQETAPTRSTTTSAHVLMDPDATNFGFIYSMPQHMTHTTLHDLTFAELREYYENSTLLLDLSLNGHEHCPREAVLFDCWPIISREENGGDHIDFPIPPELKVDPLDTDGLLSTMMQLAVTDRDTVKQILAPFVRQVLDEPRRLLNNVARTFESRSIQFIVTEEDHDDDELLWVSLLSIFEAWPLASVTLVLKSYPSNTDTTSSTTRVTNNRAPTEGARWKVHLKKGEARRNTFQRKWALRLQALSVRCGLTDISGGQDHHSLRVRSDAEMPPGDGVPDVVHGDFAVQWAGPVVVVDREQALQGFATIYSGEAKNTAGPLLSAGLWSIGGAPKGGKGGAPKGESPVSPSGAGCRALHDLAKNAGWRAAGFGGLLDRGRERICPEQEVPAPEWSAWIDTFARTHGLDTKRDAELVVGLAVAWRQGRTKGGKGPDSVSTKGEALVLLDVGSNVGLFTAAFVAESEKVGVRTTTHLFEPSWEMHHEGKRRLASSSSTDHHFHHHNLGLSDRKSTAWLTKNRDDNPGWNGLAEEHDPLTPVRVGAWWQDELVWLATLDDAWNGERVDVMKIDVEGHEASVLNGAMQTIATHLPLLYIEVAWGTAHPAWASKNRHVYAALKDMGYVLVGEHVSGAGTKAGEGSLVTDRSKIAGLETATATRNLVFACEVYR